MKALQLYTHTHTGNSIGQKNSNNKVSTVRKNIKWIIAIVIGCILCSGLTAYGAYKYYAKDVGYKKYSKTETTVEQALNELYTMKGSSGGGTSNIIGDFSPKIDEVNGISATISCDAKTTDNSEIKAYAYLINDEVKNVTKDTKFIINDLNMNSNYKVSIIAIDKNGNFKKSNVVTFTTEDKTYLYKEGNEYTTVTGGWSEYANQQNGRVQKNSNNLQIFYSSSGISESGIKTTKKIDFNKFSTLYVRYKATGAVDKYGTREYTKLFSNVTTFENNTNGEFEETREINIKEESILQLFNYDIYDYIYEIYLK